MSKLKNFLTNIKNNHSNFKHFVKYPASSLVLEICNVFLAENFIRGYFIEETNKKNIVILLRYNMNKKVFSQIINKPHRFKLKNFKNNFRFNNGLGTEIISTVKGINTSNKLVKLNLGGQKIIQLC